MTTHRYETKEPGVRQKDRSNWLRTTLHLLLVSFMAGGASEVRAQSKADEYHVKAAFNSHFFELVEWPADSTAPENRPITLCTIGEDTLGGALNGALEGKVSGGRSIRVRHLNRPDDFQGCQALFIGSDEPTRLPLLFARLKNLPVLTVGETEEFAKQGGMIALCLEGKKVRLDINQDSSRRAGLKISSRLLLLARNVIGSRE